jgi:hypothetical protein
MYHFAAFFVNLEESIISNAESRTLLESGSTTGNGIVVCWGRSDCSGGNCFRLDFVSALIA